MPSVGPVNIKLIRQMYLTHSIQLVLQVEQSLKGQGEGKKEQRVEVEELQAMVEVGKSKKVQAV